MCRARCRTRTTRNARSRDTGVRGTLQYRFGEPCRRRRMSPACEYRGAWRQERPLRVLPAHGVRASASTRSGATRGARPPRTTTRPRAAAACSATYRARQAAWTDADRARCRVLLLEAHVRVRAVCEVVERPLGAIQQHRRHRRAAGRRSRSSSRSASRTTSEARDERASTSVRRSRCGARRVARLRRGAR